MESGREPGVGSESDPVTTEIRRRLGLITHPDYRDPARRDLTRLDWGVLVAFLAVTGLVALFWGFLSP